MLLVCVLIVGDVHCSVQGVVGEDSLPLGVCYFIPYLEMENIHWSLSDVTHGNRPCFFIERETDKELR